MAPARTDLSPEQLVLVAIADLKPHPRNDGSHPPAELDHLKASITQHGIYRNVVLAQDGTLLAGHGVVAAARALGQTHVPGYRLPYAPDDPAALALLVGDNHIARLREQDDRILAELLQGLVAEDPAALLGTGYDAEALAALVAAQGLGAGTDGGEAGRDVEPQIDRAEELRKDWGVEVGQLWQLGPHRVLCGDCTDKAVVERLMGTETVRCVITDPPYGISVDTSWLSTLNVQRGKPTNKSDKRLHGDDGSLECSFLFACEQYAVWGFPYIAHPSATGWLVWDKWPGVEGGGLGNPVEMASTNLWKGFRLQRLLWAGYYRAAGEHREPHPTQKPLAVMATFIQETEGIVADFFLGSGTTLIACENLGRTCYACEIDPGYVAVTLQRWADLTGAEPQRIL